MPSTSDFDKNPYIFVCVSFRKKTVEKHSTDNNTFHGLAVTRENNFQEEEAHGSMSMAQKALVTMNDSQRSKMKILFINTYALMSKGRPYEHYVTMDQGT